MNSKKVQEKVLQQAVDHFGPVGISIMAGEDFQNYRLDWQKRVACVKMILVISIGDLQAYCLVNQNSWGVFNGFCSNKPKDANHGVLVVGFTKSK